MMPDHFSHKHLRIPCQSSVVGSQYLQAVGCALGISCGRPRKLSMSRAATDRRRKAIFMRRSTFPRIHNLASHFCQSRTMAGRFRFRAAEQTAGQSIAKMARGYEGLGVFEDVDGCDYEASQMTLSAKRSSKRAPAMARA